MDPVSVAKACMSDTLSMYYGSGVGLLFLAILSLIGVFATIVYRVEPMGKSLEEVSNDTF